jgi:hypothetical protein
VIERLRQDIAEAPEAFDLDGPVQRAAVDRAIAALGHQATESLRELWSTVGGGDMFETEELLSPTAAGLHSLADRNAELRRAGLPAELLAFHVGLHVTAVDCSGLLFALDPDTLEVIRRYDSLADWYGDIRHEFSRTYGLGDAPT